VRTEHPVPIDSRKTASGFPWRCDSDHKDGFFIPWLAL
jgi:hypothetical protein